VWKQRVIGERLLTFLKLNLTDLDYTEEYGCAFVPLMFIPHDVLIDALPRLRQAIIPDGFIFLAVYSNPADPITSALNELQTVISGGDNWSEEELAKLLKDNGFTLEIDITPEMPVSIYRAKLNFA